VTPPATTSTGPTPSTAAAREVVAALVAGGVREVVLCPGSRSAPLAYALAAADAAGALRLHVRVDERAAGFTALGLALAGGSPAAVVTTSGTAVANLHPAVLEAHESAVPLLVLSADRPERLRGTWANQTTALQPGLFGAATRFSAELPAPTAGDPPGARQAALATALAAARGSAPGARPGPVHLDVAFDDPLVPADGEDPAPGGWPSPVVPRPLPAPATEVLAQGPRTVVVAGAGAGEAARELAEAAGWPLLAEPSSGARSGPNAVGPYRLLLELPAFGGLVERAVVLGRPTLSRPVARLLGRPDVEVVQVTRYAADPGPDRPGRRVLGRAVPGGPAGDEQQRWLTAWQQAGAAAADAVEEALGDALTGPAAAREVAAATGPGELLVVAASNAVRDLDLAGRPWDAAGAPRVLANRGLSGIDGTLSTATGAALAAGAPARVLTGDLAFVHDLGGLALGPGEPEPRLQVVVLNDDGGGIFGLLEHGEPRFAAVFERVFGTPLDADLGALCRGLRVPHTRVDDVAGLRAALADPPTGRSVLEVPVDRAGLRDLHARVRSALARAVASLADRGAAT